MKILVTGGAGFIGSQITDRYLDLGHDVIVIDNFSTGKKHNLNSKARFYEVDLRDNKKISSIFEKEQPEIVNHHAAQLDVRKSVADPGFDAEVNILGIINLLEASVRHSVQKFIFASSGGVVYGDATTIPTPETYQPLSPVSPYGIAKLTSELYLAFYSNVHKLPFVALRYANIYGPRQDPFGEAGVIAIFAQKMLVREQPIIYGDGEQLRDFTFVGDVVEANVKALNTKTRGSFNIGTKIGTSVNQLFDLLVTATKTEFKKQYGPAKKGEQMRSILDATKAEKELDWKPQITLEHGLEKTVTFFINEKNKQNI